MADAEEEGGLAAIAADYEPEEITFVPPAAADEPEGEAAAAPVAAGAKDANALVEKEAARTRDGGLAPAAPPDGWATLDVRQRILKHHPIIHVSAHAV